MRIFHPKQHSYNFHTHQHFPIFVLSELPDPHFTSHSSPASILQWWYYTSYLHCICGIQTKLFYYLIASLLCCHCESWIHYLQNSEQIYSYIWYVDGITHGDIGCWSTTVILVYTHLAFICWIIFLVLNIDILLLVFFVIKYIFVMYHIRKISTFHHPQFIQIFSLETFMYCHIKNLFITSYIILYPGAWVFLILLTVLLALN